jgi:hypothetical protein
MKLRAMDSFPKQALLLFLNLTAMGNAPGIQNPGKAIRL